MSDHYCEYMIFLFFFGFFFIIADPTTFYLFPYEKEQKSRQKMTVVTDEQLGNIV